MTSSIVHLIGMEPRIDERQISSAFSQLIAAFGAALFRNNNVKRIPTVLVLSAYALLARKF